MRNHQVDRAYANQREPSWQRRVRLQREESVRGMAWMLAWVLILAALFLATALPF